MTAASVPYVLLYFPNELTYSENPSEATSHSATAVTLPHVTHRQRAQCGAGPNRYITDNPVPISTTSVSQRAAWAAVATTGSRPSHPSATGNAATRAIATTAA